MSTKLAIIPPPDTETIKAETSLVLRRARDLAVIENTDHYELALALIRDMRQGEKRITELFEPARKSLDTAKKELLKIRDGVVEPIAEERVKLGKRCEPWEAEQKRIAEEERQRKIREAEAEAEERRIQESVLAEEAGAVEAAEEIITQPIRVPYIPPERAVPKVAGVSAREAWRCEVEDFAALVKWVAEDVEHRSYFLLPNESHLNGEARMARATLNIPGCKAICETVRPVRG